MAERPILYQKQGHVGLITLNRPAVRNAIDDFLALELRDACRDLVEDDEVHVALINGAGAAFCSGAAPLGSEAEEACPAMARRLVANAVAGVPKPLIAAIHGEASGQGLELALACDLRIAARGTRFTLDQITQGQIPWDGGTQRLPRLVARGIALEMILTGKQIDSQEALKIGLVNEVVPAKELERRAREVAERVASLAPIASAYAKEAVHKGMDMALDHGIRLEADLAILLHTSRDRGEGIGAFLEKRPPSFTGR